MSVLGDLTRNWTDSLTTIAVGSLSFFVPAVTEIDPDGSLSIHFGKIATSFEFTETGSVFGIAVLTVMFLGFIFAVGAIAIQFGEFLSMLPDIKKGRNAHRKRVELAGTNPTCAVIFSNAYTAFRILCGTGAFLLIAGSFIILSGVWNFSLQPFVSGLLAVNLGFSLVFVFARYSFTYVDWLVAEDLSP